MDFLHRTWAEIDTSALLHNLEIIRKSAGDSRVMAVVKANAYGHSVGDIAPKLQQNGVQMFAVSNIDEAIELRRCGIENTVLILGYTPPQCAKSLAENNITQTVFSFEYARQLSDCAVKDGVSIAVHIKLDTGMGRIGFDCRDGGLSGLDEAIAAAKLPAFDVTGVFTHFAVSDRNDEEEDGFTDEQYNRFSLAVKRFNDAGFKKILYHCCNSAALCKDTDKHLDVCRAGIVLYGLTPSATLDTGLDFKPVMTVKSVVSMVKTVKAGDTVSYGRTFKVTKDMKIATVSAGYADGYPRLLSNKGSVIIKGKRAKIVGRICMDQFSVDVSDIDGVSQGDEVLLFGEGLPVEEIAELCGTINYEIVCGISSRVPRIIK